MRHIVENGWQDAAFVAEHATGFDDVRRALAEQSWELLEKESGATREEMRDFARMIADAQRAVFVWSMGVTQHACGVDNVRAIVNLALSKGFVGREGCGLMPIRGHSGVQGGAEMGAYATAFPGGKPVNAENAFELSRKWGFDVPHAKGLTAPEMIDAAGRGELDVLFSMGGNFTEVLPDPEYVEEALARIPLRVHMDIVLSSQMFVDTADTVLLLPASTRYETPGGVTETSTERRVIFSPEIQGHRIGEARPEWEVFEDIARRVRPDINHQLAFRDTAAIREEIASVIPFYDGIQRLHAKGDQFQYGGPHLCADWNFPTPDGKARFSAVRPAESSLRAGEFRLSTRRGKQFNSMVQENEDAITGASRDAVFMNEDDAKQLGLAEGSAVKLANERGAFAGRVHIAGVRPGNLQVHWPEANALIDRDRRDSESGIPDYNAVVRVEK
jgi:molybdopterin-dependent oxidoreductase alpha subunit